MLGAVEKLNVAPCKNCGELGFFWVWLLLAWGQLFFAASYSWRFAEYYDHGWFVPPLAAWMFWRRIRALGPVRSEQMFPLWLLVVLIVGSLAVFIPARILGHVDPRWTLPLWTHGLTVVAATHLFVLRGWGRRATLDLIPWTLLALCALALPTVIERTLVTGLTSMVLAATKVLLEFLGMPVVVLGDRLLVDGMDVTVSKGCSGIRSGNAFLMAALFFGEWMNLTLSRRAAMLALALLTAWAVNVGRATALAVLRFTGGAESLDYWHDTAGFASYVVGSLILLGLSAHLEKRQRIRRARVKVIIHNT
jgi:exosortase